VASAAIDVVNSTASDDVMKNTIDDFTAESVEIAGYATLIVAAEAVGDAETAQICRRILREEEQAAEALLSRHLPVVARAALAGAAHSTA
jgi:ferritin-like metal-binding protein YciE